MRSRLLHIFLAVLVVAGVLFIATNRRRAPQPAEPRLLVLSRLWSRPHEKQFVIQEVIRPFETEARCSVDFQTLDDTALLEKVRVQHAAGHISADVVIVYASRMRQWVEEGHVLNLQPYETTWTDRTFLPGFTSMTTLDGQRYFLPIGADTYLLCARRAALAHLPEGVDLDRLTWDQFADWTLATSAAEGEGKFALTGVAQKMLPYQIAACVLSYGGAFPDVASPAARAAWALFLKMRPAYAPAIRTYDSVVPCMKRGEAWITVAHSARVGEIHASNPMAFAVAPPPRGPVARGAVAGVSGLGIVNGADQIQLAREFLAYLTRPDIQVKLARGTGGFIPTVTEAASRLGRGPEDDVVRASLKVIKEGRLAFIPSYADWGSVKQAYDDLFHDMVLQGGPLDSSMLQRAQRRVDAAR